MGKLHKFAAGFLEHCADLWEHVKKTRENVAGPLEIGCYDPGNTLWLSQRDSRNKGTFLVPACKAMRGTLPEDEDESSCVQKADPRRPLRSCSRKCISESPTPPQNYRPRTFGSWNVVHQMTSRPPPRDTPTSTPAQLNLHTPPFPRQLDPHSKHNAKGAEDRESDHILPRSGE